MTGPAFGEPGLVPLTDESQPLPPASATASMKVPAGYRVELVAAEPLVMDPVAFDWGPDGRLWVAEMRDYPNSLIWNKAGDPLDAPGGRIKVLTDTNGDGRYDEAVTFLDGLSYPTGVKVWGKGILVTAAPEIFYAEDTDGDGVADKREVWYEGFARSNQQHRVNGLAWGLDNWLHVANGDGAGSSSRRSSVKRSTSAALIFASIPSPKFTNRSTAAPSADASATTGTTGSAATTAIPSGIIPIPGNC